jgi:hypothetical protein
LITAKLTKLPVELVGYVSGLSQNGIKATVHTAFQLGTDVTNPIQNFIGLKFSGLFIALLIISDGLARIIPNVDTWIMKKPLVLRWAGYYALIFTILLSWNPGSPQFIYFTF